MTKSQVVKKNAAKKINSLIMTYTKKLEKEVYAILEETGLWYGQSDEIHVGKNGKPEKNKHGDRLVQDGIFDEDANPDYWLHTADELVKR